MHGSSRHPNNSAKASMTDYIFGVDDPSDGTQAEITKVADHIGGHVHFNPFVSYKNQDILRGESFYLCGRLQKHVNAMVDNVNIEKLNYVNLKAAASAALPLLPSKICEYMDADRTSELASFLDILPPVEFGCIYGSSLHPNNSDKASMIDYIFGVDDPQRWHAENLKMNPNHYASCLVHLGGAQLITKVADHIGVHVHFNPFVSYKNQMFKYGVVRMHDFVQDILRWESFYLCGRLQKPVNVMVDNVNIEKLNYVNLKAATSAALLLLPSKFCEEELYAKICSLSYMGDLRMLFAEDKNKVKKIVQGQFKLFQTMYNPFLEEFAAQDLLRISSIDQKVNLIQDCGLSATCSLMSSLPLPLRSQMAIKLREEKAFDECGGAVKKVVVKSKSEAADCMQRILRRKVMVCSARQGVAGLLTVGAVHGFRYVGRKMRKAWWSWW